MPATKKLFKAIAIQIREEDVVAILDSYAGPDPEATLAKVGEDLVEQLATGGVMLDPASVRKIETAIGDFEIEDLITAVEKGAKARRGKKVIEFAVDPSQLTNIEAHCRSIGKTVDSALQECIQYCLDNGWFFSITPPEHVLKLSKADYQELSEILDQEVLHGADIVEYIRERVSQDSPAT